MSGHNSRELSASQWNGSFRPQYQSRENPAALYFWFSSPWASSLVPGTCTWPLLAVFLQHGVVMMRRFPRKLRTPSRVQYSVPQNCWWSRACYSHLAGRNIVFPSALVSGLFISTAVVVQGLITNKPTSTLLKKKKATRKKPNPKPWLVWSTFEYMKKLSPVCRSSGNVYSPDSRARILLK